jgi:hypothetical protein
MNKIHLILIKAIIKCLVLQNSVILLFLEFILILLSQGCNLL